MRRLGRLPLLAQPGERWLYDTGSAVLGVLVARASGRPLDVFMRERIFDPLGMAGTGFWVAPERLHRLATCYAADPGTGRLVVHDGVEGGWWSRPPVFPSGANGLVSTAEDYLAFARMLVGQGRHGSARTLSPESVRLMTTDHLTPGQHGSMLLGDRGWGLGLAVSPGTGRFGWDGGGGTSWFSDPRDGSTAILLTQRMLSAESMQVYLDFGAGAEEFLRSREVARSG
jgi:CubicO group peptidase (beta-lactamase class C family)